MSHSMLDALKARQRKIRQNVSRIVGLMK